MDIPSAITTIGGGAVAAKFLERILGHSMDEVAEIISEPLSRVKLRLQARRTKVVTDAQQKLDAIGVSPSRVPDSIALPIIYAAGLVDDETLQEKWANLLANAANPATGELISPAFPKILANLTPREATFLDTVFRFAEESIGMKIGARSASAIAAGSKMTPAQMVAMCTQYAFRWKSNRERALILDRLLTEGLMRLESTVDSSALTKAAERVSRVSPEQAIRALGSLAVTMISKYQLTVTGAEFVIACQAPTDMGE